MEVVQRPRLARRHVPRERHRPRRRPDRARGGAPRTAGTTRRLLLALREIVDRGGDLPLQVGANRPHLRGRGGAEYRRTYTILGDTAALAARLMARAKPGQILVAEPVLDRSRARFASTLLEPFLVKGKSRPVLAHELGAVEMGASRRRRAGWRSSIASASSRSSARRSAPARAGFGTLVEPSARPESGRRGSSRSSASSAPTWPWSPAAASRTEARRRTAPSGRSSAGCSASRATGGPGGEHGGAQRAARDRRSELVPVPLLAIPLDLEVLATREVDDLAAPFRRARLHGAVATLLDALLAGPTLVVLEDAHWLDDASSSPPPPRRAGHRQVVVRLRDADTRGRRLHGGRRHAAAARADDAARAAAGRGREGARGRPDGRAAPGARSRRDRRARGRERALHPGASSGAQDRWRGRGAAGERRGARDGQDRRARAGRLRVARVRPRHALRRRPARGRARRRPDRGRRLPEAWERIAEFVERDPEVAGAFHFRQAVFRDAAYDGLSFRRRRELHLRVAGVLERRAASRGRPGGVRPALAALRARRDHERTWHWSLVADTRRRRSGRTSRPRPSTVAPGSARRLPSPTAAEVAGVWEALGDVSEARGLYADARDACRNARKVAEPKLGPQAA